jgi:EAL domain-containing protein (putative c-di-GMP-specific phosphodiesterase class I)
MLHQLRQLGVRVLLDDFGTGYCSLAHLRGFPFDAIKLDAVLTAEAVRRQETRTIVEAVIALGRSLGMTTVAGGIETADQLALLRSAGCDCAQGRLAGQPLTAGEVPFLLAERKASARQAPVEPARVNRVCGGSDAPPASSQAA